jgi:hypothetical protein
MKEGPAGRNADWEIVGHSRQDVGSSNDLGGSGLGSKLLIKGGGSNLVASSIKDEGSNDTQFH